MPAPPEGSEPAMLRTAQSFAARLLLIALEDMIIGRKASGSSEAPGGRANSK